MAKANRNYAVDYVRNGLASLVQVLGRQRAEELGKRAALLTGLQHYRVMAERVGGVDGEVMDAALKSQHDNYLIHHSAQ